MSVILWAVDPFAGQLNLDGGLVEDISAWTSSRQHSIEPVFVLNSRQAEVPDLQKVGAHINRCAERLGLPCETPKVLQNSGNSVSSAARCLAEYADRRSANLILVSSHYRTGLTRWRFGSFSEAVVKEAPCPVLFLTSHTAQHLNKVLWATDFSPHCERTFFDFVECTEGLVQEIELFHDVSLMLEPMSFVACAGAVMPLPEHAAEEQRTWAMQRSELWLAKIEHHGMRGRLQVQVDVGDVADHVLRVAKDRGVGLIAMASQVGSLSSMIFGSESFKVFRSGELPTWIYGPQTQL